VDDDENDRLVFRSALKKGGLDVELFEATDGFAGINYLVGHGPHADRKEFPLPDVIFLDLKMQGMDGLDVLKEIRTRLGLQNLPVIIFSNSQMESDTIAAYSRGASAFHKKPAKFEDMVGLLQSIIPLWHGNGSSPSPRRLKAA
jgi:CheY-like chemotaxis protein